LTTAGVGCSQSGMNGKYNYNLRIYKRCLNIMKNQNGSEYPQNYDVIVKWMAAALRGETLEVIGVKTGRIEEVFGFEPAEISVKAGRVDLMARDETGALYHIEEQRNLQKADMYRFAAYHFLAARQWGPGLKDIILASGDVYDGRKTIITESGKYEPAVIDFTQKDGRKRLAEIREAAEKGEPVNFLELVFLPLYGKETGKARSAIAEEVIRFEAGLYRAEKIPATLPAATLIMSNKIISRERLQEIWEEIKMLDIIEIAEEKGIEKGKMLGIQEGKSLGIQEGKILGILEDRREMVMDALIERFGIAPVHISERIRAVNNTDALKGLFRQVLKCQNIGEFEAVLNRV